MGDFDCGDCDCGDCDCDCGDCGCQDCCDCKDCCDCCDCKHYCNFVSAFTCASCCSDFLEFVCCEGDSNCCYTSPASRTHQNTYRPCAGPNGYQQYQQQQQQQPPPQNTDESLYQEEAQLEGEYPNGPPPPYSEVVVSQPSNHVQGSPSFEPVITSQPNHI
ncbi:hypothetical protein PoB_006541700 [Plakobranchus ocellatus]|uniref:Uncharacterized protein n=1 Tax=Plakobranchus ocellatus TaxID=259542 RepID=A0AAV4D400_9GAST|nr:hypothetical protein PoB_006541700 [Plakobranchus ocellatus]